MIGLLTVKLFKRCGNISRDKREGIKMQISKKIKLELSDQDAATLEFMQARWDDLDVASMGLAQVG
jgi:hypothetical protein